MVENPTVFFFYVLEFKTSFLCSVNYIVGMGLRSLSEENIIEVGNVTHFFSKINVAVLELTAPLEVGDKILVKGPTTDFEQVVDSMQIEHKNIPKAKAGQSIGLKMVEHARERDVVYKKL